MTSIRTLTRVLCAGLFLAAPLAHAEVGAILNAKFTISPSRIKAIFYDWSLSTSVDPVVLNILAGTTANVQVQLTATRTASTSLMKVRSDELGGTAELCLQNAGDMTTGNLRAQAELQIWVDGGKGQGYWYALEATRQPVEIENVAPAETECGGYEFKLPEGLDPWSSYRVVASVEYQNGLRRQVITETYASAAFLFPPFPTAYAEIDESASVGFTAWFPEGFVGGGETMLGVITGSTVLTHTMSVENINRCGTALLAWSLESRLVMTDSARVVGQQASFDLEVGPCIR